MPIKYRLILFYSFVILFFILLPVFTLYSLGYRINFKTQRLERLGMIVLRTTPDDAFILFNGKKLRQKTPAKLTNLFPGEYSLTLKKEGYRPWSSKVPVKPNWVTCLDTIHLFPEKIEFEPVSEIKAARFFLSPKSRKMLVAGELAEDRGLWLLDFFQEDEILVLDDRQMASAGMEADETLAVHWSKDEKAALLEKGGKFFLLDFKKPNRLIDLKNAVGFYPQSAGWSAGSPDTFYYLHEGNLGAYSFKRKRNQPGLISGIKTFKQQESFIYFIDSKSGSLMRWSEDLLETNILGEIPGYDPAANYEIIVNPQGNILPPELEADVLKSTGEFYDLNTSKKIDGIRQAVWDKTGKNLLLKGDGRCLVLEESASGIEKLRQTESIEIPKIIAQISWFDAAKLLMISRRSAYLRQLGAETDSYSQSMFSFPSGWREIFWDARFSQLYFIEGENGRQGGGLVRVNLSQGPVSKLLQNMRETMSDSFHFIYEVRKNK